MKESAMLKKIAGLFGIKRNIKENFVRRSVLIIDDNEMDRKLVKRTVEKIGHRAMTAENGKTGFQAAKTGKPDLILSDCHMPESDGVEMYKKLREDEDTKNIPMVFLTGVDRPATILECFDMGAQNYIRKPINPKLLSSQIESIFKECLSS